MPIITMLVSIRPSGWLGHSPSASRASITCPTISADSRLRTKVIVPGVAEAAIERASDLARHAQRAAVRVGDEHHLEVMSVVGLQQPFARAVRRNLSLDDLRPRDDETFGEPCASAPWQFAHGREIADPAIVDPVPDLLGAQLGLLRLQPGRLEFGADCSLAAPRVRPCRWRAASRPRGTGTGSIAPGIGIKLVSALIGGALSRYDERILPAPRSEQRAAAASIAVGKPSST